jgi:hypothetical protein
MHLTRDEDEQVASIMRLQWFPDVEFTTRWIRSTNSIVSRFLKEQDPVTYITLNISENPNFALKVRKFLKAGLHS